MDNIKIKATLIKFNELSLEGDLILPIAISIDSLEKIKIKNKIKDYEIDEKSVIVIK